MSKAVETKSMVVSEIKDKLQNAESAVVVDYQGVNVLEITDLRAKLRAAGVEYKVYKNTLVNRAADELKIEGMEPYLHGTTALATSTSDPAAAAKIISEFIGKANKMEIKCGVLQNKIIDKASVEGLAKLPTKEVLVAQLLGVMNAPIRGLATGLNAIPRALAIALNAVAEQKQANQ